MKFKPLIPLFSPFTSDNKFKKEKRVMEEDRSSLRCHKIIRKHFSEPFCVKTGFVIFASPSKHSPRHAYFCAERSYAPYLSQHSYRVIKMFYSVITKYPWESTIFEGQITSRSVNKIFHSHLFVKVQTNTQMRRFMRTPYLQRKRVLPPFT